MVIKVIVAVIILLIVAKTTENWIEERRANEA